MHATERDDAIDAFSARRVVAANGVSISSWDPAQLLAPGAEQESNLANLANLDSGDLPPLLLYDGSGERIASERRAADAHSSGMLQALGMGRYYVCLPGEVFGEGREAFF